MTIDRTSSKLPLSVIVLNYIPLIYVAALAGVLCLFGDTAGMVIALLVLWIYLLPPLACRFILAIWGEPDDRVGVRSAAFKRWWLLTQLQTFFNRLPVLEELLRIIPSCYSLWLCLWGSRVSPFVLWSPGVRITDRYLLQIGNQAVLGWGAQLSPHVATRNEHGELELISGTIEIGAGAIIGGQAVLGPGSRVYPFETFPATRILGPCTTHLKTAGGYLIARKMVNYRTV